MRTITGLIAALCLAASPACADSKASKPAEAKGHLPEKVAEVDALKLEKLSAQSELLAIRLRQFSEQKQALDAEMQAFETDCRKRYQMAEGDRINTDPSKPYGLILRAPPASARK